MHMSIQRNDHTNAVLRSNDDNYGGGALSVRNRMAGGGSMLQQDFGEMTIAGQSTRLHQAGQTSSWDLNEMKRMMIKMMHVKSAPSTSCSADGCIE